MKLLLCDIDGTMLLAGRGPEKAVNRAFHDLFDVKDAFGNVKTHGRTDPLIIKEIAIRCIGRELTNDELLRLAARYCDYLPEALQTVPGFMLMPGVEALLQACSARDDLVLGLQTGNFERAARLKLERGGIFHYFKVGGFGSDNPERSELIRIAISRAEERSGIKFERKDIFVLGDAPQDVSAAKLVGANALAVATGIFSVEALNALGPAHCFQDLTDTKRLLSILDEN